MEDLQRINHDLSLEIDDSMSIKSAWTSEKDELSQKLKDYQVRLEDTVSAEKKYMFYTLVYLADTLSLTTCSSLIDYQFTTDPYPNKYQV